MRTDPGGAPRLRSERQGGVAVATGGRERGRWGLAEPRGGGRGGRVGAGRLGNWGVRMASSPQCGKEAVLDAVESINPVFLRI